MQFEGSGQERQLKIYCELFGIPYDELMPEEFTGMISGLDKSPYLCSIMLNRHSRRCLTHGKGRSNQRKKW